MKLLAIVLISAVIGAGVAVARPIPVFTPIIKRLAPVETKGGWVKIDKARHNLNYHRVYCITVDGMLSCDWNDVRLVVPKD